MGTSTGLKYIGEGNFVQGIPARDLDAAEVAALGGASGLTATGLYQAESGHPSVGSTPKHKTAPLDPTPATE